MFSDGFFYAKNKIRVVDTKTDTKNGVNLKKVFLGPYKHKNIQKNRAFMRLFCIITRFWCGRQELNLHGVTHKILSLARLPVPPRPH